MPKLTARDVAATTSEELARLMAGPPEQLAPWARAAAEAGVVQAQAIYGRMLLDGAGVARARIPVSRIDFSSRTRAASQH